MEKPLPRRVMIVDDEPLIRIYARGIIEEAGYQVDEAGNAEDALRALGAASFSVVLTDIEMPGSVDGIGLAWSIHAKWPYVRVIIMSGQRLPRPSDVPEAATMLTKPFTPERLVDALAEAVR
jgi:DNA-binding NtrC family response regulator